MAKWIPLWLHQLSSPPTFYRVAGSVRPWALGLAALLGAVAAYGGLVLAPPDYQQHDAYRIIFIHVPSAWMSLFIYAAMGVSAFIALVWRIKLAEVVAMAYGAARSSRYQYGQVGLKWNRAGWTLKAERILTSGNTPRMQGGPGDMPWLGTVARTF